MNATQPYGVPPPHHSYVDAHHGPPQNTAPQYGHYAVAQPPPMLPPAVSSYNHGYYPYAAPQAPQSSHFSQPMSLAHMTSGSATSGPPSANYDNRPFDLTGQILPSGMKPKITATLWEDEGTLCFQVEVEGICVARRADNCMINGTKLLNVARMTRGRRDGILKSEKHRKVIKIGPMHLKGVWIPFERALEFANKEKITEQLYPLFVHNVEQHLHQTQLQQGTAGLTGHRRNDSRNDAYARTSTIQTPAIQQNSVMPSPTSIGPAPGRPTIDRVHTFLTPPTPASAVGIPSAGGSYDWGNHPMPVHHVPIEASLNNAKSMPTTPATTPPDNLHMQYPNAPPTYTTRPVYSAPPTQHHSPYTMPPGPQYAYPPKIDMAPPARAHSMHEPISQKEDDEANSSPSYTSEGRAYTFQAQSGAQQYEQVQIPAAVDGYRGSPKSGRATPRALAAAYTTPHQHVRGPSLAANAYPVDGPQTPQAYYPPATDKKRGREDDDDLPEAKRQRSIHDSGIGSHRATPVGIARPQSMIQRH